MGHDAFVGSYKKPNFKLHLFIFMTIVGVSVFLSTQVEKSKNNTRVEALKIPVPIDSVFVDADKQQDERKIAEATSTVPVIKEPDSEYRFDSGPNLAAIDKLLAEHDETTGTDIAVEESIAIDAPKVQSVNLQRQEIDSNNIANAEREKDVAIMVIDEEAPQLKPEVVEPEVAKASLTTKTKTIAPKKIGKMDTVYELQQDRFLETLAKTANSDAEESLEVKRMKDAMRADRPLAIKSTIKSEPIDDAGSNTELVKVATTNTAGVIDSKKKSSAKVTKKKIVVAKKSLSNTEVKQNNPVSKATLDEISLTRSELNNVLSQFMRSYNKGDIQRLMALFDENATTNDQRNKQGIKSEYLELFKSTSDRDIKIRNIQWDLGKGKAKGDAKFTVTVKPVGSAQAAQVEGKLRILAVKESRGVFIKSLLHEVTVQ